MYALVDCNNFFVSCERAFQPQLEGKAVVVLSNNDGCVVARSNEAKAMGIKMGTPFFQLKKYVDNGFLEVRSSNYTLYGDMSGRIMSILRSTAPKIEVYSIDEAFMFLDEIEPKLHQCLCSQLVRKIRRWTGIPVSIGLAQTKTLCKIASHFAKHYSGYHGVCVIDSEEKRIKALKLTTIDDVWGIGWRGAPKLMSVGVKTAFDFVEKPEKWVSRHLGIIGIRTWKELQGIPAIAEAKTERKQTICTSRSFAAPISDKDELATHISDFAGSCAQKLREEKSAVSKIGLFIHTSPFRKDLPQYYPFYEIKLEVPTSSTQTIVSTALRGYEKIFKTGYLYKRAGVLMENIIDADNIEESLFTTEEELRYKQKTKVVSELMDKLNSPSSKVLHLAIQRPGHYADGIKREYCSGSFSTNWDNLLEIH